MEKGGNLKCCFHFADFNRPLYLEGKESAALLQPETRPISQELVSELLPVQKLGRRIRELR
jgi:hypothetical protein